MSDPAARTRTESDVDPRLATFGQPLKRHSVEGEQEGGKLPRKESWGAHSLAGALPAAGPPASKDSWKRPTRTQELRIAKSKDQGLGLSLSKMNVVATGVLVADLSGLAASVRGLRKGSIIYGIASSHTENKMVDVNSYDAAVKLLAGAEGTVVLRVGVAPAAVPEGWKEVTDKGELKFVHKATLYKSIEHPACIPPDTLEAKLRDAGAEQSRTGLLEESSRSRGIRSRAPESTKSEDGTTTSNPTGFTTTSL